jgi:ABC-2 type transport system ATP-binding protein
VITTTDLTKRYEGEVALESVDLEVPTGVVYGLVGPNGAGKTTLLSILAGLRSPSDGSVDIDRSRMAVLPDAPRFDTWLSGREVVELARGLGPNESRPADEVLRDAGLFEAADRAVGGYSRGMLQRLGLAATVVSNPQVVLLDEPASALDPSGRRETLDLVRRLRGDATVVFSSHVLADVQEVSDWIGVLDRGRLRYQGPADELLGADGGLVYEIRVREAAASVGAALGRLAWVTSVSVLDDRVVRIQVASSEEAERGLAAAVGESEARVISIAPTTPTLEDVFMEMTS